MDLTTPLRGLMREPDATVIDVLARTESGFTGRTIQARIGSSSRSTTQASLVRLSSLGLITRTDVGAASNYRVNRNHVLWPYLKKMLAAPAEVQEFIANIVASELPQHEVTAAVFGSTARRSSTLGSDLDIVLVFGDDVGNTDHERLVDRLNQEIPEKTGNELQLIDISLDALKRLVQADDPLVTSWLNESRTFLGHDLRQLIADAK